MQPTTVLQAHLDQALRRFAEAQVTARAEVVHRCRQAVHMLQEVLAEAADRDAAQAERPEGCWCFGFGGTNRAVTRLRPDEPFWTLACPYCPEGADAQAIIDHRREEMRRQERLIPPAIWNQSGIPPKFQALRLSTHPLLETNPELVMRLSGLEPGSWLFYGPPGTGKTGLAVGFAWEWRERYRQALRFVSVFDLLAELRATYNATDAEPSEEQIIGRYRTVPLLILDDLGQEQLSGSGWAEDRINRIIWHRHSHGLATVFTSNQDLATLAARLGAPTLWRITEMAGEGHVWEINGPNLRAR